ncbi:lysozyme inhibitor LprI family protein [Burkholderia gladioli]|uniref:lysozyme inhibitor LprI family protein n=1 Tax=Burkholderia gladioli TaxID=28095 RepID=UPI0016406B2F|nr:lysozyme inhibitor LprI family protein [Burkholderia gladioli]MDN7494330.1 lysozyme inhibitor LprI family protein [Burkholderia gladioli]
MKKLFICVMLLVSFGSHASPACEGQTTSDLASCAQADFGRKDRELNQSYNDLLKKLPLPQKQKFIDTQRAWIKYKENYCQQAFSATAPGAEASIDKWSCLASTTASRIDEIHYLDSSTGMDAFRRSLAVMANLYEGGDTTKVISKLRRDTSDGNNPDWVSYVDLDCSMTAAKLEEAHDVCVARLNFYKNW